MSKEEKEEMPKKIEVKKYLIEEEPILKEMEQAVEGVSERLEKTRKMRI